MPFSKYIYNFFSLRSKNLGNSVYTPVDGRNESQTTSGEDTGEGDALMINKELAWPPQKQFFSNFALRITLEIFLLVASLIALAFTWSHASHPLHQRRLECGRMLGQWLPDAEAGVEYEVQRFQGSFGLQSSFTGIGPETDAAWDNITDGPVGGAIGITQEQWEAVNEYHEYPVLLEKDYGTGQYLASLDVFHQLHCVDLLRKATHREYYDKHEGSFAGAPENIVQGHLQHCVEMLRQTLMCHGDISLLTYNWVEGRSMPHPNFNTVHTCKKWDTLIKWNMHRDVTVEWEDGVGKKMLSPPLKPKDVKGMKTPP